MSVEDVKVFFADGFVMKLGDAKKIKELAFALLYPLSYAMMNERERELWLLLGGGMNHQGEQCEDCDNGQEKG